MPNVEFNFGITIKVTKTMSNTTYPRPLRFGIYGCGTPSTLATKAQIEDSRIRRWRLCSQSRFLSSSNNASNENNNINNNEQQYNTSYNCFQTTEFYFGYVYFASDGWMCIIFLLYFLVCKENVDMTKDGARLFAGVRVNGRTVPTDSLANPIALSRLPTNIIVRFKQVNYPSTSVHDLTSLYLLHARVRLFKMFLSWMGHNPRSHQSMLWLIKILIQQKI